MDRTAGRAVATRLAIQPTSRAESLAVDCPATGQRGSVLVPRPDPKEEESLVSFWLLGNGAGPGVVLCRSVLYADVAALLKLMGEQAVVTGGGGQATIDAIATDITAYRHEGQLYVAVEPFARHRRALCIPSEHAMDATVWPRETLLHMKATGTTAGPAYQAAVREGLVPE